VPPAIIENDFLSLEEVAKMMGVSMKRARELQQLAEKLSGLKLETKPGGSTAVRETKKDTAKQTKKPEANSARTTKARTRSQ
jgi:hypothetical protein